MGITGWIHHTRDLRDERPTINAMAAALAAAPLRTDVVRLSRRAGLAHRGPASGYADWRHPERPDPDLAVVIDGWLSPSNRRHVEHQLYRRPRPLCSDAEVLLHAYRAWGASMVQRIDGTYTIALWDNRRRQLVLIRDPLGAKTVYYTPADGGLLFASRATALLAHPGITPVVDSDGLNELITLAGVRTPGHGVLRGVSEVLPGQLVRHTPDGLRAQQYWHLETQEQEHTIDTATHFVRSALAEHTADLRARPAGAVLVSGGLASAAVAAFTAGTSDQRPHAWTLALGEPPTVTPRTVFLGDAGRVAAHLRLRQTSLLITDTDREHDAPATRRVLDFPGEANFDVTLFALLSNIAAAGATSVVTGDGADAVFGGYPWLHDRDKLARDDFPWRPDGITPADLLHPDARQHLTPGAYRRQRYTDAADQVQHLAGADVTARAHRTMGQLTLTHYLPHLLTRLGQLADGAGLRVHTPIADWLLAQYLHNTPVAIRSLCDTPNGLLRHTVADLLPRAITWRPATGFPRAHLLPGWCRARHTQLHEIITDHHAPLRPLLDANRTTNLLGQPPSARGPAGDWHTSVAYLVELNAWLTQHHVTLA